MSKEFGHIKKREKEIIEMKAQGATHREIAEGLGLTKEQIDEFFHRKHKMERKYASRIIWKKTHSQLHIKM